MVDLVALKAANTKRWENAVVTRDFSGIAKRLVGAKSRYQAVEAKTGVPWFVIAVIHMRESSQSWTRSLAQGDPIDNVSVHVPAGRGPFPTWEAAAIDALVECGPYLARKKDWSLGAALVNLELYNGAGYANMKRPSPYLWAGTNQYGSGKYVADGRYDPTHVDQQPGCAGMILAMKEIDKTITFGTPPKPIVTPPQAGGAVIAAGTVAAGIHQGWTPTTWLIVAGCVLAAAVAAYFILKRR
jgi:lysozyme family protein